MSFFSAMKALFPRAKAFNITHDSVLRRFIKGLAVLPDDIKTETEKTYLDLFPETTRAIEEWENQFKVLFADEQYGDTRQGILKALWQANTGGQTAEYLQSLLQKVSPEIRVFENSPVKNPRDANSVFACMCGQRQSVCGNSKMICAGKVGDSEFEPTVIRNNGETTYDIPIDTKFWENYFFVCKNVVKNSKNVIIYCQKLQLHKKWRNYVEYLVLKIKPVQTGALIFIEWVDDDVEIENSRIRRS